MVNVRLGILQNKIYLKILYRINTRKVYLTQLHREYKDFNKVPFQILAKNLDFLANPKSFESKNKFEPFYMKDGISFLIKESGGYKNKKYYSMNWKKFVDILFGLARIKKQSLFERGNKIKWSENRSFEDILAQRFTDKWQNVYLFDKNAKNQKFLNAMKQNKYLISLFQRALIVAEPYADDYSLLFFYETLFNRPFAFKEFTTDITERLNMAIKRHIKINKNEPDPDKRVKQWAREAKRESVERYEKTLPSLQKKYINQDKELQDFLKLLGILRIVGLNPITEIILNDINYKRG